MKSINEKNIAIIYNVLAGVGRALTLAHKIDRELSERNIQHTLFKEKWPADFSNYTTIFIAGGDGTLNYFINHYPGIKIPLVIFKGGTGNDTHWLLYGDMTFEEQLQLALNGDSKPLDLGKCADRYFINGVGIGFEAEVSKALSGKKKLPGKTSFFISVLKKIFTYRSKKYTIKSGDYNITGKKLEIGVYNGRRAGGGFHIAPEASANDGLLDVIAVHSLNPLQRLYYLPVIEKGKHLKLSFVEYFRTTKISIESDVPVEYHLDGEYFVTTQQLEIQLLPGALNFRF